MPRDPAEFARRRYDLLVVGGGIHGLFAAYDAARRGLSVALVERGDFGSELSFNHQRTIHGGLRAIESGRLAKARQQIRERRLWARMAPHLIRPLPFLIGTYRFTKRSRWALRAGFAVYDRVGRSRNAEVAEELHLPRARLESPATTRKLFPGIDEAGLTGGAVWYDYQTRHPDRLNWTVVLAARQSGAALMNYVEAVAPLTESGRVVGARVLDHVTGQHHEVLAAATLLAAGSGLGPLMAAFGLASRPPLLRAMNLLFDRPARDIAIAARGRSGRMLTAVPWRGYVLAGTYQSATVVDHPERIAPSEIIDEMLADVNTAFPALGVSGREIRLVHHGLTPAVVRKGRADLLPEPVIRAHSGEGAAGLFSLVGVKFTTARHAAERAVDAVCRGLGREPGRSSTASVALPHAGIADVEGHLTETLRARHLLLDRDIADHLTGWYGTEASDVVAWSLEHGLADRLAPDCPILAGEVGYAIAQADALHLGDVVLRRTPLGSAGHPGRVPLERAAGIMAEALGWVPERRLEEIAAVEARYPVIAP